MYIGTLEMIQPVLWRDAYNYIFVCTTATLGYTTESTWSLFVPPSTLAFIPYTRLVHIISHQTCPLYMYMSNLHVLLQGPCAGLWVDGSMEFPSEVRGTIGEA